MKSFLSRQEMFLEQNQKKLNTWLDKLTFPRIFLLWMGVIILFGFYYSYFSNDISYLYYNPFDQKAVELVDAVYFSFITATSTGFGDIIPFGFFKIIAIVEVIFGLVLLAFVTSKLVSIKQNVILTEVYEISFHEKINRMRSSLLLFRQNIGRIIDRVEDKSIRSREVNDFYTYVSSLDDTLNEISMLLKNGNNHHDFTKVLDSVQAELIFHSVLHSFQKLLDILQVLEQSKLDWRKEVTVQFLRKAMASNESLFYILTTANILSEETVHDLLSQNDVLLEKMGTIVGKEGRSLGDKLP